MSVPRVPPVRIAPSTHGRDASCVRQKIYFVSATAVSLPLLLKKGGEGRGEEALFINYPSLRLSPRSFLAGRERQNAASVLRAEHNWRDARATTHQAPCPTQFRLLQQVLGV